MSPNEWELESPVAQDLSLIMAMPSSSADGQPVQSVSQDWDGNWEGWQWHWEKSASDGQWYKVWTQTKKDDVDEKSEAEEDVSMVKAATDDTDSETSSQDSWSGYPVSVCCCSHCVRLHCVSTTHVR